ncbi:MAG: hypothetical protein ACYTF1_25110 [Planctomycetota bacterium]|jgi:hypothetical protein
MSDKKAKLVLCAMVLCLVVAALPVIAKGPSGVAGKSKIGHVYLVEKNPADPNWPVVAGGAWGKMTYRTMFPRFRFGFNGHGLVAGQDYTLIYYPDKEGNPWPREDIICLGSDRADEDGNVHIREVVDTGDLPNPDTDLNEEGAKIWLVLSDDVDCDEEMMFGWNPTEYLFEYDLINFDSMLLD